MKVTLLGHAAVLVEMKGATCIMDPVFRDPFEEGTVTSCPRREVHLDKLPRIDVVIISHAHLDHFDIPSLMKLPRTADVMCPEDRTIVYALERLGFKKVHPTKAMTDMQLDGYSLMTTASHVTNVVEFGVVFKDATGTFWNQVDSVIAPATVTQTREHCGRIDLLFAMHASQNFKFFENHKTGFPAAMHEMNLQSVLAVAPRMAVPGAAGFRFSGAVEWCNAFLFPISREQFVEDLARLAPSMEARIANPGDVFEISAEAVRHCPGASGAATTLEGDTARLRYDPTAPLPELTDPNEPNYSPERLSKDIDRALKGWFDFLRGAWTTDPIVAEYRACRARYALVVVFPDGGRRWSLVDCSGEKPRFESGEGEPGRLDAIHRVAASALVARASFERSYFFWRGLSRKASALYLLSMDAANKVSVTPKNVPDLFDNFMQKHAPGAELAMKTWIDHQLALVGK